MKVTFALLPMVLLAFLGCQTTETGEYLTLKELASEDLDRLDKLLDQWTKVQGSPASEEKFRVERKIRRLVDANFLGVRLGLHQDQEKTKAICAAAIGFSLDIGVVRDLLDLLADPSPIVRANALLSLARIGYKSVPVELLMPCLDDDDKYVRRTAVVCLQRVSSVLTEKKIVTELLLMLGDSDFGVRMNTARALGDIGNTLAVESLSHRALSDKDDRVRYNVAIALASLKSYVSVEPLISQGFKDSNNAVQREIIRALKIITGQDFAKDFDSWKKWYADFLAKKNMTPR